MFLKNRKNKTVLHNRGRFRSELKQLIGFPPRNLLLYETAFIHRSATCTMPDGVRVNNERLEYLGDAVITAILSGYLFHLFPDASEGFLTKARARIVNRDTLNHLAVAMGVDKLIVSNLGPSDSSFNLYGNALEALVGVIFIETGFKRTSRFFIERGLKRHLNLNAMLIEETNYKSLILEYCQKRREKLTFTLHEKKVKESSHPWFMVSLEINHKQIAQGEGTSRKEAEQQASMAALGKLGLLKNERRKKDNQTPDQQQ